MEQLQNENSAAGGASDLTAGLDAGGKNTHIMRVMSSSEDMTWATPQEWFDYLNLEFGFTLDPCCWPETAKCKRYYTPDTDGLAQSWQDERVFMSMEWYSDEDVADCCGPVPRLVELREPQNVNSGTDDVA